MRYTLKLLPLLLTIAVAGCGGGGGSSSTSGTQALSLFATDSFSDDFDHVWVTIYHVELVSASGATQTVFDDPNGRSVDVKTLRDSTGARFVFLGDALAGGTIYTSVRVTIGSSLVIFPTGSTTGQNVPVADSLPRDSQGRPIVEFPLTTPRKLASGDDNLVIDFDLAHFILAGGKVAPALKEGDKTGLSNPERNEQEHYNGTVSGLSGTAPSFIFTLTHHSGMTVTVVTDANTKIGGADAQAGATLADGKHVEVRGTFDAVAKHLLAREIEVKSDSDSGEEQPEVAGVTSTFDATAGTFVLSTGEVDGFVPTQTTVNVVTTSTTAFGAEGSPSFTSADFFAKLATAQHVKVVGSYDAASDTLTAVRVMLED